MQTTTSDPIARLPAQLTHFVGRSRELGDVHRLLASTRLLTLTGVGGSGKTRLAIEAAILAASEFPGGVIWVELAALVDPSLVPQHVAATMGVRESAGRSAVESIVHHLFDPRALLVLDNCEHLVDACAALADDLLRRCPRLTILATSREALGVSGERAWLVPPLSVPAAESITPGEAAQAEAVQLFVDRAQVAAPGFDLTSDNVRAIARICRRLDGIPLALELAAARVKVLAPAQIADRLDDSFRLLSSGSRTGIARHRTLREAIDWSYALLTPAEQVTLQRLSVFVGGFSLDGAEAVCASSPLDESEVLDTLSGLVDKSLVIAQARAGDTRYRLLETVRQYARLKLREAGEEAAACERHAHFFLTLAEAAEPYLYGGAGDPVWFPRLIDESDNLRAVGDWCEQDRSRIGILLRMGAALQWFLFARGWFREGREKLTRALAASDQVDALTRARGQTAVAALALWQGDTAVVPELLEPVLPVLRDSDDATTYAYALSNLGAAIALQGDPHAAKPILARGVEAARKQPFRIILAIASYWEGTAARARGEFDLAYASFQRGVNIGRDCNNRPSIGHPLTALARLLVQRGAIGDGAVALTMLLEALELHVETDDRWGIAWALEGLAGAAILLSQPERAARLLAAADSLRDSVSIPRPPAEREEAEQIIAACRGALGDKAFRAAWNEGAALSLSAAIAFAQQPDEAEAFEAAASQPESSPALPAGVPADLRVYALGPLRIVRGNEELNDELWRSSKPRELLLFLLCHPEGVTREQVGLALWPEASATQLRNSFHVTMHRLRKGLGDTGSIEVANERYRISAAARVELDALRFEREISALLRDRPMSAPTAERLASVLALYRGDFLSGERVGDWHDELRERLKRLYRDGLRVLADCQLQAGQHRQAIDTFERIIAADELDEEAHRGLLLCYGRLGERGAALRAYQRLLRVLRDELDGEPDAETAALARQLQLA